MENGSITERRYAFIAYLLDEHKLDALLISRLAHIRYLTGFTGSNALLLATPRNVYFITDSRYEAQATKEVGEGKIVIAGRGLLEEIKKRKFLRNTKRIGFESKYTAYNEFEKSKKLFAGKNLKALDVTIEPIMLQKDDYEIDCLKKAVAISERVFNSLLGIIKPGITENEIAAEITYRHRMEGADGDSFESIVASGVRGSLPHGRATSKKIENNELIIIDFGCIVNGYHCDITRTIAVGSPGTDALKCFSVVHEALELATEGLREGVKCKKLDGIARDHIKKNGYGDYFRHSLGHGIGLDVHELPRISSYSDERFVSNSTVTLEPGIYIPERFGIRIEDDMLVLGAGSERLTTLTRDLITV